MNVEIRAFNWLRVELAPGDTTRPDGDGIARALAQLGFRALDRTRLAQGDRDLVLYGNGSHLPVAIERRHADPIDRVGLLIPQLRL